MASVGSTDTSPEILLRRHLYALGFRFRIHRKVLGVRVDVVLRRYAACIFVHGCFWHRHEGCARAGVPKANADFWTDKFRRNVERDARSATLLEDGGWNVGVVWECAVRDGRYKNADYGRLLGSGTSWRLP